MTEKEFENLRPGDKITFEKDCSHCPIEDCSAHDIRRVQERNGGYLIVVDTCLENEYIFMEELEEEDYCNFSVIHSWSYERDY
jgi:hypothetical protein